MADASGDSVCTVCGARYQEERGRGGGAGADLWLCAHALRAELAVEAGEDARAVVLLLVALLPVAAQVAHVAATRRVQTLVQPNATPRSRITHHQVHN